MALALPGDHPAAKPDQVETQPVDIMSLSPPAPTPDRTESPAEPTETKRAKFQRPRGLPANNENDHQFTESEGEATGGYAMQACQTIQEVLS